MSAVRPDWARLFRVASSLIRQVNSEQLIIDSWSFGGGTAMMLQVGHRESHDVDIFLADAQFLPFLDPKLHDFEFEIRPSDYGGDGTGSLKLAFEGIGEVDFIVAHATLAALYVRLLPVHTPIAWVMHSGVNDFENGALKRAERLLSRRARAIIGVSQQNIDDYLREIGRHPSMVVIPNGVDVRYFSPAEIPSVGSSVNKSRD